MTENGTQRTLGIDLIICYRVKYLIILLLWIHVVVKFLLILGLGLLLLYPTANVLMVGAYFAAECDIEVWTCNRLPFEEKNLVTTAYFVSEILPLFSVPLAILAIVLGIVIKLCKLFLNRTRKGKEEVSES